VSKQSEQDTIRFKMEIRDISCYIRVCLYVYINIQIFSMSDLTSTVRVQNYIKKAEFSASDNSYNK